MKIAYITADNGIPVFGKKGASIHIRELVNALDLLGHQTTVLTVRRGSFFAPLKAEVITMEADHSSSQGENLSKEENALARERRSLQSSITIGEDLSVLHSESRFDLIYERYSLWSTAGVRVARKLGIPCLVEVNSPLLEEQQKYRALHLSTEAEAVEAEVFKEADALLAVSAQVKSYVISKGAIPERTFVIQNGVDVKRFHPAVEPAYLEGVDGKFVLGFVGSLKDWHGIDILLKAFRILQKRSPDYHLLIVGDGPLRTWIEDYAREHQLKKKMTITGWVSYDQLPNLIQRMDVTVAPYPFLEDFYFSPLKLFEYMAAGKPVIASRIGPIERAIQDGKTGLLVRPGDPNDLVVKIERLHSEPALQKALGIAASAEAGHHTWVQNAHRVMEIVAPLVKRK